MVAGTTHSLKQISLAPMSIAGSSISSQNSVKYLGVRLDNSLTM